MRIGIDARIVYYSQAGIGQYVCRLVEGLSQVETDEEFVLLLNRKDHSSWVRHGRFRVRRLWTPSHHRLEQWTLPVETALARLDLLHSPDFIPPFRRTCQSVITIHDLAFMLYPDLLTSDSARYYGQIRQAVQSTDHIIAVSDSTKDDVIRLLDVPAERITVVHEAANPVFRPVRDSVALDAIRQKYGLSDPFLLFVGTLEPRKNLPELLHALHLIRKRRGPIVSLAVVGGRGWLYETIFGTTEALKLKDAVHFLGRVPTEDLMLLYNAATCFVLPSRYEGFGLPVLEAMCCGTPVVASNISSLPEVVGDAGLLVSPDNAEAWARAIEEVVSSPELRERMREKGLQRARRFTPARMARETLAVYRRVAGQLPG